MVLDQGLHTAKPIEVSQRVCSKLKDLDFEEKRLSNVNSSFEA